MKNTQCALCKDTARENSRLCSLCNDKRLWAESHARAVLGTGFRYSNTEQYSEDNWIKAARNSPQDRDWRLEADLLIRWLKTQRMLMSSDRIGVLTAALGKLIGKGAENRLEMEQAIHAVVDTMRTVADVARHDQEMSN